MTGLINLWGYRSWESQHRDQCPMWWCATLCMSRGSALPNFLVSFLWLRSSNLVSHMHPFFPALLPILFTGSVLPSLISYMHDHGIYSPQPYFLYAWIRSSQPYSYHMSYCIMPYCLIDGMWSCSCSACFVLVMYHHEKQGCSLTLLLTHPVAHSPCCLFVLITHSSVCVCCPLSSPSRRQLGALPSSLFSLPSLSR